MRRLAVLLCVIAMSGPAAPSATARTEAPAGDSYYPLGKGHKWVYNTDYADETDLIHEVTGSEKIGDKECFIVEHKTVGPTLGTRMLRKEWLSPDADGVMIRKLQRGRSELEVEKPFFKVKQAMLKNDEWKGGAKAEENAPHYQFRVDEEVDVEVPAGKYKAWKVHVRIESGTRHSAESVEWYAKNVGLVKVEMTIRAAGDEFTMVSELKKFEAGK